MNMTKATNKINNNRALEAIARSFILRNAHPKLVPNRAGFKILCLIAEMSQSECRGVN